jgi:hypothetical protein
MDLIYNAVSSQFPQIEDPRRADEDQLRIPSPYDGLAIDSWRRIDRLEGTAQRICSAVIVRSTAGVLRTNRIPYTDNRPTCIAHVFV